MPGSSRTARPLLIALLVAGLVGTVSGGPVGAEPRLGTTRTITIPAAAFAPIDRSVDYYRLADDLHLNAGTGTFEAPVYFEAPVVQIRKVVFYVVDGGPSSVAVGVYRVQLAESLPSPDKDLIDRVLSGQTAVSEVQKKEKELPYVDFAVPVARLGEVDEILRGAGTLRRAGFPE